MNDDLYNYIHISNNNNNNININKHDNDTEDIVSDTDNDIALFYDNSIHSLNDNNNNINNGLFHNKFKIAKEKKRHVVISDIPVYKPNILLELKDVYTQFKLRQNDDLEKTKHKLITLENEQLPTKKLKKSSSSIYISPDNNKIQKIINNKSKTTEKEKVEGGKMLITQDKINEIKQAKQLLKQIIWCFHIGYMNIYDKHYYTSSIKHEDVYNSSLLFLISEKDIAKYDMISCTTKLAYLHLVVYIALCMNHIGVTLDMYDYLLIHGTAYFMSSYHTDNDAYAIIPDFNYAIYNEKNEKKRFVQDLQETYFSALPSKVKDDLNNRKKIINNLFKQMLMVYPTFDFTIECKLILTIQFMKYYFYKYNPFHIDLKDETKSEQLFNYCTRFIAFIYEKGWYTVADFSQQSKNKRQNQNQNMNNNIIIDSGDNDDDHKPQSHKLSINKYCKHFWIGGLVAFVWILEKITSNKSAFKPKPKPTSSIKLLISTWFTSNNCDQEFMETLSYSSFSNTEKKAVTAALQKKQQQSIRISLNDKNIYKYLSNPNLIPDFQFSYPTIINMKDIISIHLKQIVYNLLIGNKSLLNQTQTENNIYHENFINYINNPNNNIDSVYNAINLQVLSFNQYLANLVSK